MLQVLLVFFLVFFPNDLFWSVFLRCLNSKLNHLLEGFLFSSLLISLSLIGWPGVKV